MTARTANVFVRVDTQIKTQAETVLNQLAVSTATATAIYLRQIALQRKIPFEMKLSEIDKPIAYGSITDEEFDALMNQAVKSSYFTFFTADVTITNCLKKIRH